LVGVQGRAVEFLLGAAVDFLAGRGAVDAAGARGRGGVGLGVVGSARGSLREGRGWLVKCVGGIVDCMLGLLVMMGGLTWERRRSGHWLRRVGLQRASDRRGCRACCRLGREAVGRGLRNSF
jgi:hypothetical protein